MADALSEQSLATSAASADAPEPTAPAPAGSRAADDTSIAPTATETAQDDAATENAAAARTGPPADDKPAAPADGDVTEVADGDTSMADAETGPATNGTPASGKKGNMKRKSLVPEHNKKTPKKKGAKELHLDVEPGEVWWVRTKGYPAWPAVVCDEEMLPVSLLERRPVSAASASGIYRADFEEGGKNARDRRYPVMYLGTNEFAWVVNTELQEFDVESIKKDLEGDNRGKKSLALWNAYQVAAQEHDLEWYKNMLVQHEKEVIELMEAEAKAETERNEKMREKEEKKKARLSKSGKDGEGDVDMEGAGGAAPKKKVERKRKKSVGDAGDEDKVSKKLKLKLNTTATDDANEDAPKKKQARKAKEAKEAKIKESPKVEQPRLTEQERAEQMDKKVLYLRHKLQKGFLSRDQAPKEAEMADMDKYFRELVGLGNLEAAVIRNTKINKVFKAILKLDHIPKNEDYRFTDRSTALLAEWNKTLGMASADAAAPTPTAAEAPKPAVNGTAHESEPPKSAEPMKPAPKAEAAEAAPAEPKAKDTADVSMTDAAQEPDSS